MKSKVLSLFHQLRVSFPNPLFIFCRLPTTQCNNLVARCIALAFLFRHSLRVPHLASTTPFSRLFSNNFSEVSFCRVFHVICMSLSFKPVATGRRNLKSCWVIAGYLIRSATFDIRPWESQDARVQMKFSFLSQYFVWTEKFNAWWRM